MTVQELRDALDAVDEDDDNLEVWVFNEPLESARVLETSKIAPMLESVGLPVPFKAQLKIFMLAPRH
jgi:hypothetical protein